MKQGKIAFVGTGIIGAGLAVNALVSGCQAALYDVADLEVSRTRIKTILENMVDAGAFDQTTADAAYQRACFTNDLKEAVIDAVFIQECIPEKLELKQSVYREIQTVVGADPVIASSTTALMPSKLQDGALYPERILVGHPYNPSYLLPLVEICGGEKTSQASIDEAKAMYESWGKIAVVCLKEIFGYLCQHVNWGVRDIALKLAKDGVGSPEDIDKAIMYGPGMRFPITGQLLTLALGSEGGWKDLPRKYEGREPNEWECWLSDELDQELAHRPAEIGNNTADVVRFRDKMLVAMLKVQNLL